MPSSKISATSYESCIQHAVSFVRRYTPESEVIVVAPSTESANEVIRRACDTSLVGIHAITLRNLARVLAEPTLQARGLSEITSIAREAVVTKVGREAKLDYLAPVSKMPGFPKALSRSIRELRMEDARPRGDLAILLDGYNRELQERSLADVASVFTAAIDVVRKGNHPFCGLSIVFLDVLMDHALERTLVDALSETALHALRLELTAEFQPPGVEIFSSSSESLECVEIARRAGQLAIEGVAFDRMAILSRDAVRIQPLLEEAFERAGIPIWFAGGCVRPSTSGRALLTLLQCAREGLSATRFLEYLSLGQVRGFRSHRWERMIVNAGVVGGIERWRRRLEALSGEGEDAGFSKQAEVLGQYALPILELLAGLPKRAQWREWLEQLAILADKAIYDRRPLIEFFEQLAPLAELGSHQVGLQDVIDLLADHLRSLRESPEGTRYGCVFAGSIEDARGMSFDVVFLPGLCEGSFPKLLREDPLLLNEERVHLKMTVADETNERRLLHQAAASAREQFIVSYPRIDLSTGRARVPSLYAYEVLHAGIGAAFDPRELQQRAEANAQTTLAWPAPVDFHDAIDDMEYDLALLRTPFEAVPVAKGAAAYLNQVNPLAVHVLRNRWRRWHSTWHETDGLFEDIEAQILLKEHTLGRRAYSPTALQQFAACPYRFYLSSVLRLRTIDRPIAAQRMDPRTRGIIFHRTQAAVLRELQASRDSNHALAFLEETLARIARETAEEKPPAIAEVWNEEMARIRADLRGWLSEVVSRIEEWAPLAIELSFGLKSDEEYDSKSVLDPVKVLDAFLLSGSIDVVEQHASGIKRVLDHKTGTPARDAPQVIGNGEVLQPILYALAAEQILNGQVSTGHLFYATLRGNYRMVDIRVNDVGRERMRELLSFIDESIDNGQFYTNPRKDACGICDYLSVCGPYEEERARRKSRVVRLEEIRKIK